MTIKAIYIARHGYRSNWLPPPHPEPPTGIDSDPPLAPHGVDQARELAKFLGSLNSKDKPEFILSSPFYRCVETSTPIAETLSVPFVIERGLSEWFKKGRDTFPVPANYSLLRKFFPQLSDETLWNRDTSLGVIPNLQGETEEEIFERAQTFWNKFIPTFESKFPQVETILLVTHAATKISLGMALLGRSSVYDCIDDNGTILRAASCSLDKYIRDKDYWIIKLNGETSFLKDGAEMDWNFHHRFEAGSDEDIKEREKRDTNKHIETNIISKDINHALELSQEAEEFEEIYVTVDVPKIGGAAFSNTEAQYSGELQAANGLDNSSNRQNYIKSTSKFQVTDIDDNNPLIKISNSNLGSDNDAMSNVTVIDGNIYQTDWKTLVGTDLVFDDDGNNIGVVREHLKVNENIKVTPVLEKAKTESTSVEDESKTKEEKTTFLKSAIKMATEMETSKQ